MRLTTRTNLAMRTLMFCAINEGRVVRKAEVAAACNASENHLAQVIHGLAQKGFLRTVRGRCGGLALGRPAEKIVVGDVFRTFESNLPFTECFSKKGEQVPADALLPAEMRAERRARGLLRHARQALAARHGAGKYGTRRPAEGRLTGERPRSRL